MFDEIVLNFILYINWTIDKSEFNKFLTVSTPTRNMKIQRFFVGSKEEIPEKYHEDIFQLIQKSEKEFHQFEPPHIDQYKRSWKVPDASWEKTTRIVGLSEDDEVLAYAWLSWNIKYENLEFSWGYLNIVENEEEENNRRIMLKEYVKHIPNHIKKFTTWFAKDTRAHHFFKKLKDDYAYEEFLFTLKLEDQVIEEVSTEALTQKEKAIQKGFEIIFVENLDYDKYLDLPKVVNLIQCVWNDMPRENLSDEDMEITTERYNETRQLVRATYDTFFSYVVVEKKTNDPIGITTSVLIDEYQPNIAWQWETGILQEFRGKGLGLALKYQMLEKLLTSTNAKIWSTGSSSVNVHMHRINKILGYKQFNSELVLEFTTEEIRKIVENL